MGKTSALVVVLCGLVVGASAAPTTFSPTRISHIHMDRTGYVTLKQLPSASNAAELQCFDFDRTDDWVTCWYMDPVAQLTDPLCNAGTCPTGSTSQDGGSVQLNRQLRNLNSILLTSQPEQVKKISSSLGQSQSYLYQSWTTDYRCVEWVGGAGALEVVNTGRRGELLVDCAKSDVQLRATLTGDCCMTIAGARSPNAPVKATVSGNGVLSLTLTPDSDISKGVAAFLGGERSKLAIYALPGANRRIKVFGKGSPGGPAIEIWTCPKSSAAGAPTWTCAVQGRACVQKTYTEDWALEACRDAKRRRSRSLLGVSANSTGPVPTAAGAGQVEAHEGKYFSACPYF